MAGSPSQMSAALLAVAVPSHLSRQLDDTLSCPPTNHLAKGTFHCSTFLKGFIHTNSASACFFQNRSGFFTDSVHSFLYWAIDRIWALAANSFDGLKTRVSLRWDSMFDDEAVLMDGR